METEESTIESAKDMIKSAKDMVEVTKNIGKGLATIVSPPIGLAMFPKKLRNKITAGFVGTLVSLGLCIELGRMNRVGIYDNPRVYSTLSENSLPRAIAEVILSPPLYYLDSHYRTNINSPMDKEHYSIKGKDVIVFSDGRYNFSFPENRSFKSSSGLNGNLALARQEVEERKKDLSGYLEKGDIFASRRARRDVVTAESRLKTVEKAYAETKEVFEDVVDKMNSELESLAENQ